jgi:hypothetical protein
MIGNKTLRMESRNPAHDELRRIATERMTVLLRNLIEDHPELMRKAVEEVEVDGVGGLVHGLRFELGSDFDFLGMIGISRRRHPRLADTDGNPRVP